MRSPTDSRVFQAPRSLRLSKSQPWQLKRKRSPNSTIHFHLLKSIEKGHHNSDKGHRAETPKSHVGGLGSGKEASQLHKRELSLYPSISWKKKAAESHRWDIPGPKVSQETGFSRLRKKQSSTEHLKKDQDLEIRQPCTPSNSQICVRNPRETWVNLKTFRTTTHLQWEWTKPSQLSSSARFSKSVHWKKKHNEIKSKTL